MSQETSRPRRGCGRKKDALANSAYSSFVRFVSETPIRWLMLPCWKNVQPARTAWVMKDGRTGPTGGALPVKASLRSPFQRNSYSAYTRLLGCTQRRCASSLLL